MSIFDRLDRLTSKAVDRTFSIQFECFPGKRAPNGRPGPDPEREIWTGKGAFSEEPNYHAVETGPRDRKGNDMRALATGAALELSVDCTRFLQASTAKQGDRIQFDDLRRFQIVTVEPDGLSRIVFRLVEIR